MTNKKLITAASALMIGAGLLTPALAQDKPRQASPEFKAGQLIDRFDGNKDGSVTLAEYLAGERERFAKADLDQDGFVTMDELETAFSGQVGRRGERIFTHFDADSDGRISLTEVETKGAERGLKRFLRLDADQDGFVTKAEFGPLEEEAAIRRGSRMMERLDGNKDGSISLAEADRAVALRFARLDADLDGIVTVAELTEGLKRRPHGKPGNHSIDQ